MKTITLKAPFAAIQTLADVIKAYVAAAYPAGGSECAQSAREALLTTGQQIINGYDTASGSVDISRRIKAHLKSALEYYPQTQTERTESATRESMQLLRCLNGQMISQQDWDS